MSAGTFLSGGRPPATPPVAAKTGQVHRLGPIDQVPFGEGRTFDVAGEQVAVFRLRSGSAPVGEQPVASSKVFWCSGHITICSSTWPSAMGPPRWGQTADSAYQRPLRSRKTATCSPPTSKVRPSPNGTWSSGPSR